MTICISLKVPDGLVLAADSLSAYPVLNPATQQWDVVQSYSYANKVIQIGDLPVGALVWGLGSIQRRSMESLLDEFSTANSKTTISEIAVDLAEFIKLRYEQDHPDPTMRPPSGLLVGGYDHTNPFASEWAFEFPATPTPIQILPPSGGQPMFGVNWFGQNDALSRLMNGFDARLPKVLKGRGLDPSIIDDVFSQDKLFAEKITYELIFDGMPLQDAVDFAAYLVHIVKGRFRFVVGPKLCGGPVDIAVVKRSGFEWIRKKSVTCDREV